MSEPLRSGHKDPLAGLVAHLTCYRWQVGLPAIQLTASELLNFNVGDDRSHSFPSRS